MATPLICLKISPENVKQLSVKTSSAKRSSVSVEGSLTVRWSKKYLSAKRPSLFGITVYREVMSMVKRNLLSPGKLNYFKMWKLNKLGMSCEFLKYLLDRFNCKEVTG